MGLFDDVLGDDAPSNSSGLFDDVLHAKPSGAAEFKRRGSDALVSLGKGAVAVPESLVGIGDIATSGHIGKLAEEYGFKPKAWRENIESKYSPEQKAANEAVRNADGFLPTVAAAVKNPSTIFNTVVESAPSTVAGGAIGRLATAGRAAPVIAGAAGEGLLSAGSTAEQIRQENPDGGLTGEQALIAAGSGAATGLINVVGGKTAQKLGIHDVDTMMAGGKQVVTKGLARRVGEGAASEGAEELLQSGQEQAAQNVATGKPIMEGVGNAAATGMLAGHVMGGAANVPGPLTAAANVATPEDPSKTVPYKTQEAAQARADAMTTQYGVPFEVTPHTTVGGAFAVTPVEVEDGDGGTGASATKTGVGAKVQADNGAGLRVPDQAGAGDAVGSNAVVGEPAVEGAAGKNGPASESGGAGQGDGPAPVVPRGPLEAAAQLAPAAPAPLDKNALAAAASASAQPAQSVDTLPPTNIGAGKVDPLNLRMASDLDVGAHEAASSPLNDRSEPTDPQKAANNAKLGNAEFQGLPIKIENPQGSVRSSKPDAETPWKTLMTEHYGYIKGTKGADGDAVDAFVGPSTDSQRVFVVDQNVDGKFDEHKVMLGFDSLEQAKTAYYDNYQQGWKGGENITETSVDGLRKWLKAGDTAQPFGVTQGESPSGAGATQTSDLATSQVPTESQPVPASDLSRAQQPAALDGAAPVVADQTVAQSQQPAAVDVARPSDVGASVDSSRSPDKETDANSTPYSGGNTQKNAANTVEILKKQAQSLRNVIESGGKETPLRMKMEAQLDDINGKIAALSKQKSPQVQAAVKAGVMPDLPEPPSGTFMSRAQAAKFATDNGLNAAPVDTPDGVVLQPTIRRLNPQEAKSAVDKVAKLNEGLVADGYKPVKPALDGSDPQMAIAQSIAKKAFGVDVTAISGGKGFDGVRVGNDVFVSRESVNPVIAVTGHEVYHFYQEQDVGKAIRDIARQHMHEGLIEDRQYSEDKAQIEALGDQHYLFQPTSRQYAENELVADLHGSMWMDPKFWGLMAQKDAGVFRKVAYKFMEYATKALKVAHDSRLDASSIVRDVEAAREAIATAWAEHHKGAYNDGKGANNEDSGRQASRNAGAVHQEAGSEQAESRPVQDDGRVRGGAGVLERSSGKSDRPAPLKNLPATVAVDGKQVAFGPHQPAREAEERYKKKAGIDKPPVTEYVKVDKARATRIASAFEAMEHNPSDPAVKASYDAMIKETLDQYQEIKANGLKIEFIRGEDPYGNPRNAILDVVNNNHLWVFPTNVGFGGSETADVDTSGNPLLAPTKEKISGQVALVNDIFRVVHDYFGHIKEGVGFRADGEENAWQQHASMYSDAALPAMTSETRGQNSWLNFGPFAEFNKTANGADTQYAPQKIGMMPEWTRTEGRAQFSRTIEVSGKRHPIENSKGQQIANGFPAQVAFWKWFGESKAVDSRGRPLVAYHGTPDDFSPDGNLWFSQLADDANVYAQNDTDGEYHEGANVIPVYLKITNPLVVDADGAQYDNISFEGASWITDDLADEAGRRGHDGLIVKNVIDGGELKPTTVFHVMKSNQIKSSTGNNGSFDPKDPRIQFSRAPAWIDTVPGMTPDVAEKVGLWTPQATVKQRFDGLKKDFGKKFVQGVFDQFAPIKELDFKAYMQTRMAKSTDGGLEGMLLFGKLKLDNDGALTNDLSGGFIDMMKKLKGEQDRFFAWIAGNRAADLKAAGRENLFTDTDITALRRANQGLMADGSSRSILYANMLRELNSFSKSILDIAEKTGTINGAERSTWEKDFYVPFYRVLADDEKVSGPRNISGLTNQYAFKKLKGGTNQLNDLMQNTIMNWSHLLSSAMKNQAATSALKAAELIGAAHTIPEAHKGTVFVLENGKKVHYEIDDPFLLDAVSSLSYSGLRGWGIDLATKAKRALSYGVTFSPSYRVRNLIRDQLQAIAANPMSYNVASNLVKGFKYSAKNNPMYAQMISGGALVRMGSSYEDNRAGYLKQLIGGIDQGSILDSPEKVKAMFRKALHAWQEVGDRAESVTRAAIYEKAIADGKSHLEASYLSRDSMDFGLQGSWPAVRLLTQTVPFMNARLQGLYKLGRAWNGDKKRFMAVVGATSMATIAMMLANRGDDDWEAREEWDRDNFWWFKTGDTALRIPKPFEIGAMATIAERGLEMVLDGMDAKSRERFASRLLHIASDNLSMNPIPQLFKPPVDIYSNTNSFTGRPIESPGMERLSKANRIGAQTTATAELLGKAGVLSPVQIDAAIAGYFGWLGTHAAMAADAIVKPALGLPDKPSRRLDDLFVVGDWVKQLPSNQSRFVDDFYQQAKNVSEAVADLNNLKKMGNPEAAKAFVNDNRDLLKKASTFNLAEKQISNINLRLRQISASEKMLPDEKRAEIDRLSAIKLKLAERVVTK